MKKGLLKAGVLLLLFAAALGGTAALINREKIVGTRQMEDASLPILYMEVADTKVNPMYGYAGEMEEQYMRDSLTPLPTDRSLTMAIDPKNASVKTVSYRVSTADGTEVVETSKISKLKKKDGEIRAEFQLETPILMNQEYTLRFDVTLDNGETSVAAGRNQYFRISGICRQLLSDMSGLRECIHAGGLSGTG